MGRPLKLLGIPGGGGIGLPDCDRSAAGAGGRTPAPGTPEEEGTPTVDAGVPSVVVAGDGAGTELVGRGAACATVPVDDGIGGRGADGATTGRLPAVVLPGRLLDEIMREATGAAGATEADGPASDGGRGPGATATGRS